MEITAEKLKVAYPDLMSQVEEEGFKAGLEKGKAEGQTKAIKEPDGYSPEEAVKALLLIREFKKLSAAVQESGLSVLDFENFQNLSQSGDTEAKTTLEHWLGSGPSFWNAWGTPVKYYNWLKTKKKG